jgi:hypothetical protein
MIQPVWNFEQEPWNEDHDETAINLRAYFDRMRDEKMRQYNSTWSDEQIIEWDGNFTTDGNLLLGCSERDVEIEEYRSVIAQAIAYRKKLLAADERG